MSRYRTAANIHQGKYTKVLCVCSQGCLRAPTAAWVLSNEPFNYNTRACGISQKDAIIILDDVLLYWADEIIVFDSSVKIQVYNMLIDNDIMEKPIIDLCIEDDYNYRDPVLCNLIYNKYLSNR